MLEKYQNFVNMMKIVLVILARAHILAILYHTIAILESNYIHSDGKTWI